MAQTSQEYDDWVKKITDKDPTAKKSDFYPDNTEKTSLLDRIDKHRKKIDAVRDLATTLHENRGQMEYAAAGSGQSAESNKSISEAQSPLVYYDPAYEKKKKQMGL